MSSRISASDTMSSGSARTYDVDVKLERPVLVMAAATATTRLLQKAGVSCHDFLLAFQNSRFRERMSWSIRESVAHHKRLQAAAAEAAARVNILAQITSASGSGTPTSPEAFLRRHPSTTAKQRLSFVARIIVDGQLSKALVVEFSPTQIIAMTIKKGSSLYTEGDFRIVTSGSLVYLSGLLRGTRNGEPCLVFDRDSRMDVLKTARFSDVRRLNARLDAEVYGPRNAPTIAMPSASNNTRSRSIPSSSEVIYIDCTEEDFTGA